MQASLTRFDDLLNDLTPKTDQCFCPKHHPPMPPSTATGRDLFSTPEWSAERATIALGIKWWDVWHDGGNPPDENVVWGLSAHQGIWLNPKSPLPVQTAAHELAHQLCGHSAFLNKPAGRLLEPLIEVEADAVAMLVCDALGLEMSVEFARHSIQHWTDGLLVTLPDGVKTRVKRIAQQILSAGATLAAAVAA